MLGKEFLDLVCAGVRPIIKINKRYEELETQFEEGMLAIVEFASDELDGTIKLRLNESQFKRENRNLEKPAWKNNDTGMYELKFSEIDKREDISYMWIDTNEEIINFSIVEDDSLQMEFIVSNCGVSYIEWLENQVLKLRSKTE